MEKVTIAKITTRLSRLPQAELVKVYRFISFLSRKRTPSKGDREAELAEALLIAESAWSKDWDNPQEDRAWANL